MDGQVNRLTLLEILGAKALSKYTKMSPRKLNRYIKKRKKFSASPEARLDYLAKVVSNLRASYNYQGIRRWFVRERYQLKGRSPDEILRREWSPFEPIAKQILELAISSRSSEAT